MTLLRADYLAAGASAAGAAGAAGAAAVRAGADFRRRRGHRADGRNFEHGADLLAAGH